MHEPVFPIGLQDNPIGRANRLRLRTFSYLYYRYPAYRLGQFPLQGCVKVASVESDVGGNG
jgi:hypothetical protein